MEDELQFWWKWYFLFLFAYSIADTAKKLPNIPNIKIRNKQQTHASNFNVPGSTPSSKDTPLSQPIIIRFCYDLIQGSIEEYYICNIRCTWINHTDVIWQENDTLTHWTEWIYPFMHNLSQNLLMTNDKTSKMICLIIHIFIKHNLTFEHEFHVNSLDMNPE